MAFWSTETLKKRLAADQLINPYCEDQVTHCAYELTMGPEAFITSTDDKKKSILENGEPIVIPPGQFALLLTEATVKIPLDAIGFISMRFGVKRRGLVNVSGFHVDPGFDGRLKFSVYNAGSKDITLSRGERVFLIWYASLDTKTADGYGNAGANQNTITSDDQNVMHGEVASPGQLKKELADVKNFYSNNKLILTLVLAATTGILVRFMFMDYFAAPSWTDVERLKSDLKEEIKQELIIELKSESDSGAGSNRENEDRSNE